MIVDPATVGTGWAMEASTLFTSYLFATFPFRKVYLETLEFNYSSFRSGEGTIFVVEGCLKNYEFYQGRYWHKYVLSVARESWNETAKRFGVDSNVSYSEESVSEDV
jgi:RimJ/RimL family protein N-acetyltransferase